MRTKLLFGILLGLLLAALAGCGGARLEDPVERDQILEKAEPMADSLFQGMREHDYAAFARDFDPTMQKAMDEKAFEKMMQTIDPLIGKYQSREVAKLEKVGKYVAVTYTARYELEDAVSWRLVFTTKEPVQISGLWYDSPKLRQK